ncbi:FHA domain-containing protein [Shewanella salipaludis]|uniref:FHA domain-containing protein n=1 Tax=Shewanella salipaludis TaxID=2723052 RepID=A0A972G040_9GAMM|nr:FHA domain-containing protein [Shewanella salipaludis]
MAYLIDNSSGTRVYLCTSHSFGRLLFSVQTEVPRAEVSKIHCLVEWENQQWLIRDISLNGTWVNGERLEPNKHRLLHLGDRIKICNLDDASFDVQDLSPPIDMLIPHPEQHTQQQEIPLARFNILPNEQAPELLVYYDTERDVWTIEEYDRQSVEHKPWPDHDNILLSGQKWQLFVNEQNCDTRILRHNSVNNLTVTIKTSLDEESTQLIIDNAGQTFDLGMRSHHYLTLLLARYRVHDIGLGIAANEQGWRDGSQLMRDLKIDANHLNILIYRARKQFASELGLSNSQNPALIGRRPGKMRFNVAHFTLKKGDIDEYVSPLQPHDPVSHIEC